MSNKVAVVTGSNQGIGFAIVKGLCRRFDGVVYLTSLNVSCGKAALAKLNKRGLYPEYHQLDITDRKSIADFRDHIRDKHGGIDILINNAGVVFGVLRNSYEEDEQIIDVNYKSMFNIQQLLFPLLRENARILNISSSAGHLSNVRNKYWLERLSKKDLKVEDVNEFVDWYLESVSNGTFNKSDLADNGSIAAYRVSKVAMSALTIIYQKELEQRKISVNSMYPGIVRTDMTSGVGFLSAKQAAETPLYLVLDAPQTLKGQYVWYDKTIIDWHNYDLDVAFALSHARSVVLRSSFSMVKYFILNIFKRKL